MKPQYISLPLSLFFKFQEIKQEAITSRTVDNKKFFKDLSCDDLLNTDNFFGPEMFVTSGAQCFADPSSFL